MKKFYLILAKKSIKLVIAVVFFICILTNGTQTKANPIPIPIYTECFISALKFDSDGEWIIELKCIEFRGGFFSLIINTSSGCAIWESPEFYPQEGFIIKKDDLSSIFDDLSSDLTIHREGDFVKVKIENYTYDSGYYCFIRGTSQLIFGNYPGATVRSPKEGEIIACVPVNDSYFSDNIGLYTIATDDGTFCKGKIVATIHNSSNHPFSETTIKVQDNRYPNSFYLRKQEDSTFTGDFYSCYYHFDKLLSEKQGNVHWIIEPVQFEMEQDTVIFLDIYITDIANIQDVKNEEHILKIYPNPVVDNSFYYETALPVKSANSRIEIIGLNGKTIMQSPVYENKGKITLPSNTVNGIYNVSLIVNNRNYVSAKIVVP